MTRNKWDESALRNQIANIFVRDVLQEDYDDLVEGYLDEILAAADKIILLAALPPTGGEGVAAIEAKLRDWIYPQSIDGEVRVVGYRYAAERLAALQDSGQGEGGGPRGWLIKDFADGWVWTGQRIAAVAALTDGHSVFDLAHQAYATPANTGGGDE